MDGDAVCQLNSPSKGPEMEGGHRIRRGRLDWNTLPWDVQ